jgi:hypothetical protein
MKSFILLLVLLPNLLLAQPNYTTVLQAIRQSNMQALATYWDTQVELTIGTSDHFYDATKTSELVADFLKKNKPSECTIVHSGSASDKSSHYLIGKLVAGGKVYRLYILFKAKADKYVIQEMRFEPA